MYTNVSAEYLFDRGSSTIEDARADVLHIAISGAHSSGKTTLLQGIAESLSPISDFIDEQPYVYMQARYMRIGTSAIPVVLAPEGATGYTAWIDDPHVMAENNTFEDQIGAEVMAGSYLNIAVGNAAALAVRIPHGAQPLGIVLSDRTALDGYAYSKLRFPDRNQELIDVRTVSKTTGLILTAPDQPPMPIRAYTRQEIGQTCDLALFCDEREVSLEDNGNRVLDEIFRRKVGDLLYNYYANVITEQKCLTISGTKNERVTRTIGMMQRLVLEHL